MPPCPFCPPYGFDVRQESDLCLALPDRFPISPGHTLIIPRRHVASFFDLSPEEKLDLLAVAESVRAELDLEFEPSGYNIGLNDGAAAGQTVPHVHLHLIPRYAGDQADPRGGVRLIFPDRAKYWKDAE